MEYQIRFGLSGGFGGAGEWEDSSATTERDAMNEAYEAACQEYDSYAGLHGLRSVEQIMEEDDVDAEYAEEVYQQEREDWIEYKIRTV